MADWDSLINELKNEKVEKEKPEIKNADDEDNRDFEFGDALDDSTRKRVKNAMAKAEIDPLKMKPFTKAEKIETAGDNWFNMKKVEQTEQLKRDWELLRMRSVLQHGGVDAAELPEQPPEYLHYGIIKDNPIEGSKNRLSKKYRTSTIAESLAKDTEFRSFLENNYRKLDKKKKNH